MHAKNRKFHHTIGLHIVALFEGAKGVLVLLTGFGLLTLIHQDLHLAAERLVRRFHLNPASHYPRIFIDAATHMTNMRLWMLAASALLYTMVRFIEAFGLWKQRPWAEWFAILTGGIYIPVEIYELLKRVTWPKIVVLVVNVGIVGYLAYDLDRTARNRSVHNKRKQRN